MKKGKVFLVGAGPGDAGLITVRGLNSLKQADVIVYDRLIDDKLLDVARADAERMYVGKSSYAHSLSQKKINQLLIEKAEQGGIVVRLKGGDPFVFGRGGEEAEVLANRDIPFEVVPGISSALAVPAYAGIPVTHRGLASSFAVVTGHESVDKGDSAINWGKLTKGVDTLVFLMGRNKLGNIIENLISNGRPSSSPVAVISDGTRQQQRTIVGTLDDIITKVETEKLQPPAVIIIGEVVRLREKLRWFDAKPLFGKRVLVTRARHQASQLSELLISRGAIPIELAVIDIQSPSSYQDLDRAISDLHTYHWVIFTSVNGVEAFFQKVYDLNLDARCLKGLNIGAIGVATAGSLMQKGIRADCVPRKYTSKALITELKHHGLAGCRVLLPRADIAGKDLTNGLTELGAEVDEIVVYKTVPDTESIAKAKEMILAGQIDIITFTSSSTVTNLSTAMKTEVNAVNKVAIACIGPETETTAINSGMKVDVIAEEHTLSGLVEALERWFQEVQNG